jgi:hypothetical protein
LVTPPDYSAPTAASSQGYAWTWRGDTIVYASRPPGDDPEAARALGRAHGGALRAEIAEDFRAAARLKPRVPRWQDLRAEIEDEFTALSCRPDEVVAALDLQHQHRREWCRLYARDYRKGWRRTLPPRARPKRKPAKRTSPAPRPCAWCRLQFSPVRRRDVKYCRSACRFAAGNDAFYGRRATDGMSAVEARRAYTCKRRRGRGIVPKPVIQVPPGTVFGHWVVLDEAKPTAGRHRRLLCRCRCGGKRAVQLTHLRAGAQSCRSCRSRAMWQSRKAAA